MQHLPQVRYVSIHQTPAFPYLGESNRRLGTLYQNIQTIPIRPESSWTCGYQQAWDQALEFVANNNNHNSDDDDTPNGPWIPHVVVVCAGYDALDSDELASVSLQARDYQRMTRQLLQHVDQVTQEASSSSSGSRPAPVVLFGLEGGYQLSESAGGGNLPQAVVETLKGMQSN